MVTVCSSILFFLDILIVCDCLAMRKLSRRLDVVPTGIDSVNIRHPKRRRVSNTTMARETSDTGGGGDIDFLHTPPAGHSIDPLIPQLYGNHII